MPIYYNNSSIKDLYINDTYISHVYYGNNLVYAHIPYLYKYYKNGTYTYYRYIGSENVIDFPLPRNNINLADLLADSPNESLYINNKNITRVYLRDIPFLENRMFETFRNCTNLTAVFNINQNVTNMFCVFQDCTNLILPPVIPNSVTNMIGCCKDCWSLKIMPIIPNSVYSLQSTFYGCSNLTSSVSIPNSVTDMSQCFDSCLNLQTAYVPNSVVNMHRTFHGCNNLTNINNISKSCEDLSWCFFDCEKLQNIPTIPNSVVNMDNTFKFCSNISTISNIPTTVISMDNTFNACYSLEGNIIIESANIETAENCFVNTSKNKDIYIPFRYENSEYTVTYNSFISAGYSTSDRVHGVLLLDINDMV